jgi:phosphoenolpyruvate---glycerone phosphotransferase subunit DhaL
MPFTVAAATRWINAVNKKIQENKQYLTSLDQAIGDGDHGLNMARGFQAVVHKLEQNEYEDLGVFFKDVGMTSISKVGGAAGPLYGTVFMKLSLSFRGQETAEMQQLADAFSAAVAGLKERGRAQAGDKTMLDVWEPVVTFLTEQGDNLQLEQLTRLAQEKLEITKDLEAKKGRAAYLGKRSVGHLDPGAASSVYLFAALADVLKGEQSS